MSKPRRLIAFVSAVVLFGLVISPGAQAASNPEVVTIPGGPLSATDTNPVQLDADLYLPNQVPAPAIVLAHGFGGDKSGLADQANALASAGFVVLAYSARGFGESTGLISVNSPDFEVTDASAIIDYLATRPEVELDSPDDPTVGFAGGSYGGALALLIAGYDDRVDALASDITWNDLESSLFGQSVSGSSEIGAYKNLWTGFFFSRGLLTKDGQVTNCGRFSPQWCDAYVQSAQSASVTPENARLMQESSPGSITDQITAPALITGGQADSLFPLAQTNANAQQIREAHPQTPVAVMWHGMGHDGGTDEREHLDQVITNWFTKYLLNGESETPVRAFEVSIPGGSVSTQNTRPQSVTASTDFYPGIFGSSQQEILMAGPAQSVIAPAGGTPATITSVPGLGGALAGLANSFATTSFPGQDAFFQSAPLEQPITLVGSSQVSVAIKSDKVVNDAVLFASLQIVSTNGRVTLPQALVAPIRIGQLTTTPQTITIDLPTIVAQLNTGDSLRIVISTTDMSYRLPTDQRLYTISMAAPTVSIPLVTELAVQSQDSGLIWLFALIPAVLLALLVLFITRRRSAGEREAAAPAPVKVSGLSKIYKGGYQAVNNVSFDVPAGVVLGLLGPNGAGKTTTMRMIMGLIAPTEGEIELFGEKVTFGAPALQQVGALIEGPGFLPHLTGRKNLELYWRSTGRPGDPYLDEILEIADLGSALDRKVKAYSQGMRQRLGIAQAMLGKPNLLVLDEPTNGLDPPQIMEMRAVMKAYAATGRTIIVSSHMLSEVEQTCSHVVVMHRGHLIATGEVSELLRDRGDGSLEELFMEMIGTDLTVGK